MGLSQARLTNTERARPVRDLVLLIDVDADIVLLTSQVQIVGHVITSSWSQGWTLQAGWLWGSLTVLGKPELAAIHPENGKVSVLPIGPMSRQTTWAFSCRG